MIPEKTLDYLEILHGSYNTLVMFLFLYQGWLGLKIRRMRTGEGEKDFTLIRKHRKAGPLFALLGILGFIAGLVLVAVDKGHLVAYPLHFFLGLCLASLIAVIYFLSKKIKGPDSSMRTPHFIIGITLIVLYLLQVFIGLDVLF